MNISMLCKQNQLLDASVWELIMAQDQLDNAMHCGTVGKDEAT